MKITVWVVTTTIPVTGETTPCIPSVFATEAEAEAYADRMMRGEWEDEAPWGEETGEPLPYPDDWREAQDAILADNGEGSWGEWQITSHEITIGSAEAEIGIPMGGTVDLGPAMAMLDAESTRALPPIMASTMELEMFKPLLAAKAELDMLTFPMIASPKIDGIRCLIDPALGPVSRTMKPIPNLHVRQMLSGKGFEYLDGEIVTYDADSGEEDDFNAVQSKVMREDGKPNFLFHAFDSFKRPDSPYTDRMRDVIDAIHYDDYARVHTYEHVFSAAELAAVEARYIDHEGWEGVMLRKPDGRYKMGRSTAKEQILLKIKRFEDDEAIIVGTVERMHNANEARKDAFGRTERSSHQANMIPTGTLGALSVEWRGVRFEIGTGMDDTTRASLWCDRDRLIGQSVTFKYQGVGSLGAPRFPVFLGLRLDMVAA